MSSSRIVSLLSTTSSAVKHIAPPAITLTAGALCHAGKEVARDLPEGEIKDSLKNTFATTSSAVGFITVFGCNAESLNLLIQAWPHLSKNECITLSLTLTLNVACYIYPAITFGAEKQIAADYILSTLSILAAKATTLYADHVIEKNSQAYARLP